MYREKEIDFLDMGARLEMEEPGKFGPLKESWEDMIGNIIYKVSVETVIKRTFDLDRPINVTGEVNGKGGE